MNKKKDNSNLMMTLLKGRTLFVLIILFIFFFSLVKVVNKIKCFITYNLFENLIPLVSLCKISKK